MRAGTLQVSGGCLETGWWGPGPPRRRRSCCCTKAWAASPCGVMSPVAWPRRPVGACLHTRASATEIRTRRTLPRPMTYMHHEAQVVLPEVLRGAGIRHAVLIGHSDGGSIAAIYAGTPVSSFPAISRPSRLGGASVTMGPRYSASLPSPRISLSKTSTSPASARSRASYQTGDLRQRLARYHRDVEAAFRGWNDAWLDPRFRAFDITGFLPTIQAPILALQGADDPYGTDDQLKGFRRQRAGPRSKRA